MSSRTSLDTVKRKISTFINCHPSTIITRLTVDKTGDTSNTCGSCGNSIHFLQNPYLLVEERCRAEDNIKMAWKFGFGQRPIASSCGHVTSLRNHKISINISEQLGAYGFLEEGSQKVAGLFFCQYFNVLCQFSFHRLISIHYWSYLRFYVLLMKAKQTNTTYSYVWSRSLK